MKRVQKLLHALLWTVIFAGPVSTVVTLSAGCSTFGLQSPQSTEDKFQYAKSTASGAYKTIGDLKSQGRITANDGIQYFNRVESFENQFPEVELLIKAKASTAADKVDILLRGLLAIETELKARK